MSPSVHLLLCMYYYHTFRVSPVFVRILTRLLWATSTDPLPRPTKTNNLFPTAIGMLFALMKPRPTGIPYTVTSDLTVRVRLGTGNTALCVERQHRGSEGNLMI